MGLFMVIENTVGAGIFGSMMTFGTNVAEAGVERIHTFLRLSLRMVDQAMVVDEMLLCLLVFGFVRPKSRLMILL